MHSNRCVFDSINTSICGDVGVIGCAADDDDDDDDVDTDKDEERLELAAVVDVE